MIVATAGKEVHTALACFVCILGIWGGWLPDVCTSQCAAKRMARWSVRNHFTLNHGTHVWLSSDCGCGKTRVQLSHCMVTGQCVAKLRPQSTCMSCSQAFSRRGTSPTQDIACSLGQIAVGRAASQLAEPKDNMMWGSSSAQPGEVPAALGQARDATASSHSPTAAMQSVGPVTPNSAAGAQARQVLCSCCHIHWYVMRQVYGTHAPGRWGSHGDQLHAVCQTVIYFVNVSIAASSRKRGHSLQQMVKHTAFNIMTTLYLGVLQHKCAHNTSSSWAVSSVLVTQPHSAVISCWVKQGYLLLQNMAFGWANPAK